MNRSNLGKIYISSKLVENNPNEVADILSEISFVPVRVEHYWVGGRFEYEGLSPLFRELPPGRCTPLYELIMSNNRDGIIEVKVVESKNPVATGA